MRRVHNMYTWSVVTESISLLGRKEKCSAPLLSCARQNVLPGVMYRQNRYTAAALNIVHNSIFYSLQVYYNVTFAERKAKSTLIGSAGMREITAFMMHHVSDLCTVEYEVSIQRRLKIDETTRAKSTKNV